MTTRISNERYYGEGSAGVKVPYELTFNPHGSAISGIIKSSYVQCSSSTRLNPGDTMRFEVPSLNFLQNNAYLKFKVIHSAVTANIDEDDIRLPNSSIYFKRVQITVGSTPIDTINDYGKLYSSLIKMNAGSNYTSYDGEFESIGRTPGDLLIAAGTAPIETVYLAPLLGIFDSVKDLPLELFTSNLVVSIELEAATNIGGANYRYQVDNPKIYITTIDPGAEYKMSLRQQLQQAGVMKIPYATYSGSTYSVGAGETFTQTISESSSSILGMLMIRQTASATGVKGNANTNGFQRLETRLDSVLTPAYTIEDTVHAFAEVQKTFSQLWDVNATGSVDYDDYTNGTGCVLGVSFKRYNDASVSNKGSPCTRGVDIQQFGNTAAATIYVWLVKEQELLLYPNGEVMVRR